MFDHKLITNKQSRSKLIHSLKIHIDELIFEIYISIINEQIKNFQSVCIITEDVNFSKKLSFKNLEFLTLEDLIKKENNSFDLIIIFSILNFRNKIDHDLNNIKLVLKKDGLLLCSFFSENNLNDFKKIVQLLEIELFDGVSQRFHPIVDIRDIGNVFSQLGYENTVIQREKFSFHYDSFKEFLIHMRKMAFTNSLLFQKNHRLNKSFFLKLEKKFSEELNNNIIFEVLISCSWKRS